MILNSTNFCHVWLAIQTKKLSDLNFEYRGVAWRPCCMPGTMKMFCIRMNILSHRNNIVLFLACNMAAMQNLYSMVNHSCYKKLVRKPGKLQRNKHRSKDLCWKVHDPAQSFVLYSHPLAELHNRDVITVTFLLVSSSGTNHD